MAYAVPRNAPAPGVEIILPQPLPPSAVAQYRQIAATQLQGDFHQADAEIARLDDTSLLGPLLAARYLSPTYRSSYAELLSWYAQYAGQPDAPAIYDLLLKKRPHGAAIPAAPSQDLLPEVTATAGAAATSTAPENHAWRLVFAAGLAAWQHDDIAAAEPLFIRAAGMDRISDDDHAAAAFWTARAALRLQQPAAYLTWLQTAAADTGTFYGMIAARLQGQDFGPSGLPGTLSESDISAVDALPDGHLAFGLLQIGEPDEASLALRALWPDIQQNPALAHAVMAVAAQAGLVDIAISLTGQDAANTGIAGLSLPLPALHPTGGFTVDPPLVYALARTESGFDSDAVSAAGASGLMQLMPVTAHYIARSQGIPGRLNDPSTNLALGQGYIRYLGGRADINNNLLAILASYNAGPNNAAAWYSQLQDDSDPLMFIETISNPQTRRFVHQVLADSWIYAEEIGIKPASLDDLAQGGFPQLALTATAANN